MRGQGFFSWLRPSRTSQAVALVRAQMPRPSSPEGDPDAQELLCRGMRPTSAYRLRPQILARTRFFDDQVMGAISAGVSQVVICGAGYDDRALRFRSTGVRFFELDHPATQTDKARRLRAITSGTGTGTNPGTAGLTLAAATAAQPVLTRLRRIGTKMVRGPGP
jgi:methyltransferase (TIGR00027 family)